MNYTIMLNEPLLTGNEKKYLNECIDTNWISSEGPFVKKLEEEFSHYTGAKYGSCVSNGSVAIDLAIKVLKEYYGWQNGDEIIIPSFTIISSAQGVIYNNLKPVFIDAEPLTWNIDTSKIENMITPKTKAIMVVHIYGLPVDMRPILKLAEEYGLKIIEDAAQAHGLKYFEQKCGALGDISTFSFYTNKHITAGEGGMVMTSSEELNKLVKYYRNLCFTEDRFVHHDLGWNFRMSNLQAAVAYAQFERLEEFINIKKQIGRRYSKSFENLPLQLPCARTDYAENNYWVYGVVLNDDVNFDAKHAREKLAKEGIMTRPFFYPMHKQPAIEKMGLTDNIKRPISEKLYERGFYIPSGIGLSEKEQDIVIEKIKQIYV